MSQAQKYRLEDDQYHQIPLLLFYVKYVLFGVGELGVFGIVIKTHSGF